MRSFTAIFGLLVLSTGAGIAVARTYEIRPTVVETEEEFEKVANALQSGDELVLHGGTYSQTGRRAVTAEGTPERPIVIRAASGETPLLTHLADRRDRENNIEFVDCDIGAYGAHGVEKNPGWRVQSARKPPRLSTSDGARLEHIQLSADGRGFASAASHRPFRPWGVNYGNHGRLMEDFWEQEWDTLAGDFARMKEMGANVVRVHLQFGRFMDAPDQPNAGALQRLGRLLALAETTGLYLDVTGLACLR